MGNWDYPKLGKCVLLVMLGIEIGVFVYLVIENQHCRKAVLLSSYLLGTAVFTFVASALAIPLRFYFHHWIIFFVMQGLAIAARLGAIVWIEVLNGQISDELFITQEGYAGLMRTSLIFAILQMILIY